MVVEAKVLEAEYGRAGAHRLSRRGRGIRAVEGEAAAGRALRTQLVALDPASLAVEASHTGLEMASPAQRLACMLGIGGRYGLGVGGMLTGVSVSLQTAINVSQANLERPVLDVIIRASRVGGRTFGRHGWCREGAVRGVQGRRKAKVGGDVVKDSARLRTEMGV